MKNKHQFIRVGWNDWSDSLGIWKSKSPSWENDEYKCALEQLIAIVIGLADPVEIV